MQVSGFIILFILVTKVYCSTLQLLITLIEYDDLFFHNELKKLGGTKIYHKTEWEFLSE